MIITKLKGGLGNQMFQYATGRIISHKTSIDLQVALKEAINEQAGIEAQVAGKRSEYLVNQTGLAKEKLAIGG